MAQYDYGDNLRYFLGELANADAEQIETGEIEVFGEDDQGREGSATLEVTDLVAAAVELIDEQAARIKELESDIEDLGHQLTDANDRD